MNEILKGWEFKKSVLSPVLVNLLTALILFLITISFKNTIYRLLKPEPVPDFPLYAVAEPYNENVGADVKVDVFIVNLTEKPYLGMELKKLTTGEQERRKIETDIQLLWKRGRSGTIKRVVPDSLFNQDKGKWIIEKLDQKGKRWRIHIQEIAAEAVLKFTVFTNYKVAAILSRNAKASSPIRISYPRKP